MFDYSQYQTHLACGSVDMRKSINGLCEIVMQQFQLDPREKIIFAFCNRSRNRVKLLVWEDNGFWIHFKRVERGTIPWPEEIDGELTMEFGVEELMNLIKSPGLKQKIKRQEVWKNH